MTGLLICSYNRPDYLRQCLESIKRADLSQLEVVMIIDDKSDDPETVRLINEFELEDTELIKAFSKENRSIKGSLLHGCDMIFKSCDIVINLDGDAIVSPQFVNILMNLKERFQENIITGFCCFTKNRDGSERHKVLKITEDYTERMSVGGINMLFDIRQYNNWVRPTLVKALEQNLNWDDYTCRASIADGHRIITSKPSCVQHIGIGKGSSSMGHGNDGEPPDYADDFIYDSVIGIDRYAKNNRKINLSEITLIGADGLNIERLIKAVDISCKHIDFGAVKILSHLPSNDPRVVKIRPLLSSKDYSQFVLKEMVDYIDTDYALIVQHDGYVLNHLAWIPEFIKYDMVGASWKFRPEKRTANGGFSLRSRRMMKAIQEDNAIFLQNDHIIKNFAEDHVCFYIYRKRLEQLHQVKIAPEDLCDKFSIESWGRSDKKYTGQFGFHGRGIDFSKSTIEHKPY